MQNPPLFLHVTSTSKDGLDKAIPHLAIRALMGAVVEFNATHWPQRLCIHEHEVDVLPIDSVTCRVIVRRSPEEVLQIDFRAQQDPIGKRQLEHTKK